MSEFTYVVPDPQLFLYTLRRYLEASKHDNIAALLANVNAGLDLKLCHF